MPKFILLAILLSFSNLALACSSPFYEEAVFVEPRQGALNPIPAPPVAKAGGVHRGGYSEDSCGDIAGFYVQINLRNQPTGASFQFEISGKNSEEVAISDKPIIGHMANGSMTFYLSWVENCDPVDLKISIIAYSITGQKSKPTILRVMDKRVCE